MRQRRLRTAVCDLVPHLLHDGRERCDGLRGREHVFPATLALVLPSPLRVRAPYTPVPGPSQ